MSNTVISVENLSKAYRLGQIGTGRLADDFKVWWARKRGRPNPFLKIGEMDHGNRDGETIWALKDVSFSVEQGDTLGIIGRNGAGKSTLLKILSQVTAPTSGLVKIKGRIASLLEVGTGFHPDLTGRENTYLNGAILGMTREEVSRKFDEIVDFSGIGKFIDTPVKRYSSGMYVRLAFAVAAHLDPEILVVDEVLAVGDAEFQKKCLGKMGEVAKGGRTVLFVSHNLGSIRQLCHSSMLLGSGQIVSLGPTSSVLDEYLNSNETVTTGLLSWDPDKIPGDEDAKLLSVRLCDKNSKTRSEFGTSETIFVELNYLVLKNIRFFTSINLFASDGTCVCFSSEVDSPESYGQVRLAGDYISRCEIPAKLLNIGTYSVAVNGEIEGIKNIFSYLLLPSLQFKIISSGGPTSIFNNWKRPGVIAPEFIWKYERRKAV